VSAQPDAAPAAEPRLAVVLATPDDYASIRRTVAHLARQSIAGAIELVLVGPVLARLDTKDPSLARFARVRRVQTPVTSIGAANAAGALAAGAPIVAFAEDHAFPEPGWAEALVAAHAGPWVAVAPVVTNANPASTVSRADLWIGYGPWLAPAPAGERPFLPGHNTSYKRAALVALGPELATMLDAETLLHWNLRERGERLLLESAARLSHTNFSRWRSWLPAQFHGGRLFAGLRAQRMPGWRRVVYTLGAPLIAPVRMLRMLREARMRAMASSFLGCAPALAVGLACDALGQLLGYAFGPGNARRGLARYEFHRYRHLRDDERARFGPIGEEQGLLPGEGPGAATVREPGVSA